MFATPLTGEKTSHVIQHCLEAWSAWGKPTILKTDNGPAYTSTKFQQFCHQMDVTHLTGLPYNPQGQGIVEGAHRTLKSYLIKQKGGIKAMMPKMALSLIIFTLNFLKLDNAGRWGIMSTFPLPMPVMHNVQIFPHFFTTDKELRLAYLPLDEQIQALLDNRTFFLHGSLCFMIISSLQDKSQCISLYYQSAAWLRKSSWA